MLRSPKTGFQPIYVISEHLFFVSIQHQFLQRKLTVKYRTSFFIYNISIEIKLILFSTMIFHCQIKRSSVQTRFNKYIFHLQRAGNRQFHRLPNTGRLVTIKTMGYIFQKITLRRNFSIFLFTLTNRRIEEINCSTTRFGRTAICFTDHFHHNQIFTGLQQFTSINLYFAKHTDM